MTRVHKKTGHRFIWLMLTMLLLAGYVFVLWDVKTKVETANFENNKAAIAYDQKDKIEGVINTLEDIAPDSQRLDSFFVGADSVVDFINLLEENGDNQNVVVETVNVTLFEEEAGDTDLPYGEVLQVSFNATGGWNDVLQYVRLVEGLPYNIWIESIQITLRENENEETGEVTLAWTANAILNVIKHPES